MSIQPNIVSIGAGHVAHHLIPALFECDCNIMQVFSRTEAHAASLAHRVDAQPLTDIRQVEDSADLYLFMITENAVDSVLDLFPDIVDTAVVAHTAGTLKSAKLYRLTQHFGCFYPLQTFRKANEINIREVPFIVYGHTEYALRTLRVLARQISDKVIEGTDDMRLRYHLAAVLANNFTNHLVCKSREYLRSQNLDPTVLDPIIRETFLRLIKEDPCAIQTGPAVRNAENVLRLHEHLINEDPLLLSIYKSISKSITDRYENSSCHPAS